MADTDGTPDQSADPNAWRTAFDAELDLIAESRPGRGKDDAPQRREEIEQTLTGMSLSGGGVRSAVFCMGVLGYFAKNKMLSKFDYLSSVSGGGYSGSALSFWRRDWETAEKPGPTSVDEVCPFTATALVKDDASDLERRNSAYMRHVRANISYLVPSGFRGMLSGSFVVVRSILINVLIWLFLLAALFEVLALRGPDDTDKNPAPGAFSTATQTVERALSTTWTDGGLFAFFLVLALGTFVLALGLLLVFSPGTYLKSIPDAHGETNDRAFKRMFFGYKWRRLNERVAGVLLTTLLVSGLLGVLPLFAGSLDGIYDALTADVKPDARALGVLGTLLGIATSLFGFFRAKLGGIFGRFSTVTLMFGSFLLVYSILLLATVMTQDFGPETVIGLGLVASLFGIFCNINDVSLGRFYRDRLMEAFMPSGEGLEDAKSLVSIGKKAEVADLTLMTSLKDTGRPLHLINCNIMANWSPDTRAQRRKGDNFVISALHCGSDVTGWRETEQVAKGKLTLPTAMATSGAAVNPGGGFAGTGPTTNPVVSFAMALLSLRLGYWLRWNNDKTYNIPSTSWGNRFDPSLVMTWRSLKSMIWPAKHRPDQSRVDDWNDVPCFVEITDGGHFENLGLYELIRRNCRLIVVCDGGEDPETSYSAFSAAIRRVREDFGAEIKFDMMGSAFDTANGKEVRVSRESGPSDLVARPTKDEYPKGADYATRGYFLASITYGQNPLKSGDDGYREGQSLEKGAREGVLIYLKSAMIPTLDVTTKGYRGENPLFPYDPTSNQFFSPEQFEAYRDMGFRVAEQMDKELELSTQMGEASFLSPNGRLMNNYAFKKS